MSQKKSIKFALPMAIAFVLLSCNSNKKNNIERVVRGVKVENCHYDLGTLKHASNEKNLNRFCYILQNTTNQDVYLDSAEVSCSCLHVDHSPQCIKAHNKDSVTGHIDIADLKGNFSRSIYVNFDDGDVMLLRVSGSVE